MARRLPPVTDEERRIADAGRLRPAATPRRIRSAIGRAERAFEAGIRLLGEEDGADQAPIVHEAIPAWADALDDFLLLARSGERVGRLWEEDGGWVLELERGAPPVRLHPQENEPRAAVLAADAHLRRLRCR